jgi:hypothetical protein
MIGRKLPRFEVSMPIFERGTSCIEVGGFTAPMKPDE